MRNRTGDLLKLDENTMWLNVKSFLNSGGTPVAYGSLQICSVTSRKAILIPRPPSKAALLPTF